MSISDDESESDGSSTSIEQVGLSDDSEVDELLAAMTPKAKRTAGQTTSNNGARSAVAGATVTATGTKILVASKFLVLVPEPDTGVEPDPELRSKLL